MRVRPHWCSFGLFFRWAAEQKTRVAIYNSCLLGLCHPAVNRADFLSVCKLCSSVALPIRLLTSQSLHSQTRTGGGGVSFPAPTCGTICFARSVRFSFCQEGLPSLDWKYEDKKSCVKYLYLEYLLYPTALVSFVHFYLLLERPVFVFFSFFLSNWSDVTY